MASHKDGSAEEGGSRIETTQQTEHEASGRSPEGGNNEDAKGGSTASNQIHVVEGHCNIAIKSTASSVLLALTPVGKDPVIGLCSPA
mmetsp:Transcript_8751/g.17728  ORF Transcript_8751/g.17728 Transcript_8751/m.17728 type:complete len:87 (+) Transcript_8751:1189-1449(+)